MFVIPDDPHGPDVHPVQIAVRMIGGKWNVLILLELENIGVSRFKELQRRLHPISQKALTRALRGLQSDGLVDRASFSEMPLRVEYRLTARSRALLPILSQMDEWAQRYSCGRAPCDTTAASVYRG